MTWTTLALLGVLATGSALAQGPGPHGPHGFGGPPMDRAERHERLFERWADLLDLTEEQRGTIEQIRETYHDGALGEAAAGLKEARGRLHELVGNPDATEVEVGEAARAAATLEEQFAIERHRMKLELLNVLDEEQRALALELQDDPGPRFEHRRGGRRGNRDGAGFDTPPGG